MRALEDLVRAGKVIYPAVSNWSAWQTQRAVDLQERNNWARLQVDPADVQPGEAPGRGRDPADGRSQRHRRHSLQPGRGGPAVGQVFRPGDRAGCKTNKMYEARYGDEWMFEVAEKYVGFCKQKGLHPVSTAIAWVGAHPAVTAPIIGARNLDQLKDSLGVGEDRHDAGAARRDRRPLAHAAAGDRPAGGAEGGAVARPVTAEHARTVAVWIASQLSHRTS